LLAGAALIVVVVAGVLLLRVDSANDSPEHAQGTTTTQTMGTRIVYLGDVPIRVELAETPQDKQRGLSGRDSLLEGEGMLFVYQTEGLYGFWMPDMRFSIDIVWIDRDMRVVHVAPEVPPESYPATFKPDTPALFVLEVPAGFMDRHGLGEGAVLTFAGE